MPPPVPGVPSGCCPNTLTKMSVDGSGFWPAPQHDTPIDVTVPVAPDWTEVTVALLLFWPCAHIAPVVAFQPPHTVFVLEPPCTAKTSAGVPPNASAAWPIWPVGHVIDAGVAFENWLLRYASRPVVASGSV